jgi:hypothetical protein
VDLLVPSTPATFRLVSGAGPLHLVGSHCVTHYGEAEDNKDESQDESEGQHQSLNDKYFIHLSLKLRPSPCRHHLQQVRLGPACLRRCEVLGVLFH